jgi:hypothetical protein
VKYYELIQIVDAQGDPSPDDEVDIAGVDHWIYTGLPPLPYNACDAQIQVTGTVQVLELTPYLKKDLEEWKKLTRIHRFDVGPFETFMSSGSFPSNRRFKRPRGGKNILESEDEQAKVIVNWRRGSGNSVGVHTPKFKGGAK